MNINIVAKGFKLTPGTHEGVESELSELNKLIGEDNSYRVLIKKHNYGEYECLISTYAHGHSFNIKATRKSIRSSIEAAANALKDAILESKSKVISKKLNSNSGMPSQEASVEDKHEVITKNKEVHLTPISDAEAIEQLNSHDFDMYMYLDEATLETKGVYHRDDGYGVITFKAT